MRGESETTQITQTEQTPKKCKKTTKLSYNGIMTTCTKPDIVKFKHPLALWKNCIYIIENILAGSK